MVDQREARQEHGVRGGKAIKSLDATLDWQPVLEWRNVARADSGCGPDEARGKEEKKLEAKVWKLGR